MKKYLMTGVAALAFAATLTSCSKAGDLYDEGAAKEAETQKQTEQILASYNQAFLKTFGQPAADQDWGFGSSTVAGTRAVPDITFPTFKDGQCPSMPTQYSNTVPANAKYAKDYQNYQQGDVIYINTAYQELNQPQNTQDLTIYVDGDVTFRYGTNQNGNGTTICVTQNSTLKLYSVSERLTVYLAPNAKLDLSECQAYVWHQETNSGGMENGAVFTKGTAALYMSTGSRVEGGAIYFKDDYTVLNEGGTIDVGELHVENGAILYNKNKVKATGVIALRNTKGEIDNFGTMEGASMTLDANARFYNVAGGEVTITGLTKINNDSGNNAWQNSGQFNTGSFEITGGCQDPAAFNNCHMSVTNKFFMNHGNFVLDGGAAVECGSFEWQSDNYFHMGGKALLKVTGELLANNQNNSPKYGFWGDATDYAVIQAGSIVKGSEGKCRAAYYGNLFIDTNNHFEQGRSSADGTWYYFDDTVKFSFDDNSASTDKKATKAKNFSITIPRDDNGCTPGYKYGEPESYDVCIIAEDLSANDATDYDFNDVVFEVKYTSETTATVQLKAAGGTLPLTVAGNEVHAKFGYPDPDPETGKYKMINTGAKANVNGATAEPFTVTNIDRSKRGKDIIIKVNKGTAENPNWIEMQANAGEPAAKLAVESGFEWCDERQPIAEKYPKFPEYVKDKKVVWY